MLLLSLNPGVRVRYVFVLCISGFFPSFPSELLFDPLVNSILFPVIVAAFHCGQRKYFLWFQSFLRPFTGMYSTILYVSVSLVALWCSSQVLHLLSECLSSWPLFKAGEASQLLWAVSIHSSVLSMCVLGLSVYPHWNSLSFFNLYVHCFFQIWGHFHPLFLQINTLPLCPALLLSAPAQRFFTFPQGCASSPAIATPQWPPLGLPRPFTSSPVFPRSSPWHWLLVVQNKL